MYYRAYQAVWDDVANDTSDVSWGEEHLAALTAWDRTSWAQTRDQFFNTGLNQASLDIIEKVHTSVQCVLPGSQ